jgi:hypothetical protein
LGPGLPASVRGIGNGTVFQVGNAFLAFFVVARITARIRAIPVFRRREIERTPEIGIFLHGGNFLIRHPSCRGTISSGSRKNLGLGHTVGKKIAVRRPAWFFGAGMIGLASIDLLEGPAVAANLIVAVAPYVSGNIFDPVSIALQAVICD